MIENCESKVANLLASMDNLPLEDVAGRLRLIEQIVELQGKQIERLQRKANEGKEESVSSLPKLPRPPKYEIE